VERAPASAIGGCAGARQEPLDRQNPPLDPIAANRWPARVVQPAQEDVMRAFARFVLAGAAVLSLVTLAPVVTAQEGNGVSVTVQYKGKGTVDASHRLWVWLFDNPNIGPEAIPIGEQSIDKNGGTATFQVTAKQVYVAVAYDEAGGFAGQAPPPSGSPIALYGQTAPDEKPQPVTPGAGGKVKVVFTDALRMP
jgi:hypothetical protein